MMTTLADRIAARLAALPDKKPAELARFTGVKPSSVAGWQSGKSKNMLAQHVWKAAEYLECDPHWLATGVIRNYSDNDERFQLREPRETIYQAAPWPFETIDRSTWKALSDRDQGRIEQIVAQEIGVIDARKKKVA